MTWGNGAGSSCRNSITIGTCYVPDFDFIARTIISSRWRIWPPGHAVIKTILNIEPGYGRGWSNDNRTTTGVDYWNRRCRKYNKPRGIGTYSWLSGCKNSPPTSGCSRGKNTGRCIDSASSVYSPCATRRRNVFSKGYRSTTNAGVYCGDLSFWIDNQRVLIVMNFFASIIVNTPAKPPTIIRRISEETC